MGVGKRKVGLLYAKAARSKWTTSVGCIHDISLVFPVPFGQNNVTFLFKVFSSQQGATISQSQKHAQEYVN